jgi:hypothetical protein
MSLNDSERDAVDGLVQLSGTHTLPATASTHQTGSAERSRQEHGTGDGHADILNWLDA